MERIVEAYIGEYASGKSEVAVNRALDLLRENRNVSLVDFDIVEPFYTLRSLKKDLEKKGLNIVAWDTKEIRGLGETGNILKPQVKWALRIPGDIILDIGYGVEGSKTLNLLEEKEKNKELKIIAVVNIGRPLTSELEGIIEYIKSLGVVHAIINNSHLGNETEIAFVQLGAKIVSKAAKILGKPVVATIVDYRLSEKIGRFDCMGNPVRCLYRYMDGSYW